VSTPRDTVYLDHAATTPLDERVRAALAPWLGERCGNPSSRHRAGVAAARAVEDARQSVARTVGADAAEVLFTAGGTEANNLGVLGAARALAKHGRHVVVGPTEHASVREAARALGDEGFEVATARLTATGALDLEHAASLLRPDTVLVAQMLVQNEVGTIYPVRELARRVRVAAPKAHLHVDGVQALGKLELSFHALDCDSLALSAHKLHGPQGVGALVLRSGRTLRPLVFGGGQERGLRAGTENVAGCVGFGAACELAERERAAAAARLAELRDRLVQGLSALAGVRVLAPGADDQGLVPHIVACVAAGAPSEVRMHHLEELGVVVSAGSACQSRKAELSPSLLALGLRPEEARSLLRISLARDTTSDDIERLLAALAEVARRLGPARAAPDTRRRSTRG